MRWVVFGVCVLLFAGGFGLGYWLGSKGKKAATWTIAACLLVVLLRVALTPTIELAIFPFDFYAIVRPWWPFPFSLGLLGAGMHHMSTKNASRGIGVFAVLLFFSAGWQLLQTARFDPREVTGVVWADGICRQTTDYSCGAAAAVTLLHHYGIRSTEREMAERCWTNALTGTDVFCVARGLRQKVAGTGRGVQMTRATWEDLVARTEPAMATIKFSLMVDHWVVVKSASEAGVDVQDPILGKRPLSKQEFLEIWRRGLLSIDKE